MLKSGLLFLISIFLFMGCSQVSNPKPKTFNINTADFSKATNEQLCEIFGYRNNRAYDAKKELLKRNIFTQEEWKLIQERKIKIGMTECGLLASYGLEGRYKMNYTTQDKKLISKSYFYKCKKSYSNICPYVEIKIKNNKIVEINKIDKL